MTEPKQEPESEKCEQCAGRGWFVRVGEPMDCPDCDGTGVKPKKENRNAD